MGVYSSLVVYPTEFDEIDDSECDNCTFECDVHGYCKFDSLCGDCTFDCINLNHCVKEVEQTMFVHQDIKDQCAWDFYNSSCGDCVYGLNDNCHYYTDKGCPNEVVE